MQHEHYLAKGEMDDIGPQRVAQMYTDLLRFSMEHGIYIDQLARRITPLARGRPLLKDCSACGTKRVYHPGGRWMNCTNNTEEDTSQHSWSTYLPLYTESCHGCIGIGICGGGCIADAKALNPGGFDPRHCESTRAIVRSVLGTARRTRGCRRPTATRSARTTRTSSRAAATDGPARSSVGHDAVQA